MLYSRLSKIDPVEDLKKYNKMVKYDFGGVIPGSYALKQNFWLYPVIFREPKKVIAACRLRGIQALSGKEVHCLVRNRAGYYGENPTPEADRILENIVLLPITIETSEEDVEKVHGEVSSAVNALNRGLTISPFRTIAKI